MNDDFPPKAKSIPKELSIHGHNRIDNYFWLNDRENPEVIKYLENENAYLESKLNHTKPFQEKLFAEIKARIKENDMSVPYFLNGYWYYSKFEEKNEYPIYCRKKGALSEKEEIILNVNKLAEGHEYYQVADFEISIDNSIMAFSADTVGRRQYSIFFKDLKTGQLLSDEIKKTNGGIAWANDNKTLFYTINDEVTLRSYKVLKHTLGAPSKKDQTVFEELDETFSTDIHKNKSRNYLVISSHSTLSTETRMLPANNPDGAFKIIQPRERDHEYSVEEYKDELYILTNWKAKNFRLMKTTIHQSEKENWKELIPHREEALLENIDIFKNFLVVEERKNGLSHIRIMSHDKKQDFQLEFNDPTYTCGISFNPEFDTDELRYGYTSLTTPNSTFEYNMKLKSQKLLKQQEVIGDFKPEDYASERLYAKAQDGVMVPISLVYKKGMIKDGKNPTLLYGYGSYGATMDPYFSSMRLSLLNRGFVFAIAHIRGGQEMGRSWYEEGKLLKKKNTFNDFISCAEHLIAENFTNSSKLFAEGGSAGGLLMGAIINMRPDLFKGVIAAVPFVDVMTTMLDESIPLTTGEFDEWGNPKDKTYYDYMLSYSPYDNVKAAQYPAMLVTTGLHDSQVQYWEPAKWVAKLRELKTDANPLYLKTDMSAGHGGKSGRFKHIYDTALEYAFLFDLLGISQ
jgi:oligopeptidase B